MKATPVWRKLGVTGLLCLLAACSTTTASGSTSAGSATEATVTGATHVIPLPKFALPSTAAGCLGAKTSANGSTTVPITVDRYAGQVAAMINVCINGRGPYPFLIDSGDSSTVVDAHLAATLQLPKIGSPQKFEGVGCTATAGQARINTWTAAGLALDGQTVSTATIPGFGGAGQPVGLLGADVLSRFGAVRLDFAQQKMVVPTTEGSAPTGPSELQGSVSDSTPSSLINGAVEAHVPMDVQSGPGYTQMTIRMRFGTHKPVRMVPDTGSSQSAVNKKEAAVLGLSQIPGVVEKQTTVCSEITIALVHSGSWSIAGVPLRPQPLGAVPLGSPSSTGFVGLLGSDQLATFGSVVFDFANGQLLLGTG